MRKLWFWPVQDSLLATQAKKFRNLLPEELQSFCCVQGQVPTWGRAIRVSSCTWDSLMQVYRRTQHSATASDGIIDTPTVLWNANEKVSTLRRSRDLGRFFEISQTIVESREVRLSSMIAGSGHFYIYWLICSRWWDQRWIDSRINLKSLPNNYAPHELNT